MKTPTEKEMQELLILCRAAAPLRQGRRNAKRAVAERDSKQIEFSLNTVGNICVSTKEGEILFSKIKL
jgi:hypothetical protein